MDSGVERTQKIVVAVAIILGIIIVLVIGYSLWRKAKIAEGELANKILLDEQTQKRGESTNVSLTGESKNTSLFNYDNLTQKRTEAVATETTIEVVNETVPIEVPPETEYVPDAEPEIEVAPQPTTYRPPANEDRPLTAEEIRQIRQLPVENSPSGNLQNTLEVESGGEYKAQYY